MSKIRNYYWTSKYMNFLIFSAYFTWVGRVFHNFVDLQMNADLAMSPEIEWLKTIDPLEAALVL